MVWSRTHGKIVDPIQMWADTSATFDAVTDSDVYNWRASGTRRLYRSLAAAAAGTGYSDHLIIGDDQSYHRTVATADTYWPTLLRSRMVNAGVPLGGTGWVRVHAGGTTNLDSRVTKTGTWTITAYTSDVVAAESGATMTFTSDVAGTIAQVAYKNTSGAFTVAIDGGSPVTVTPSGATTIGTYTVSGLSNATHTIVVTTSSATAVSVVAFAVSQTSGLRVHNLAGNGMSLAQFKAAVNPTVLSSLPSTLVPTPNVVHVQLGLLDAYNATATFQADLASVRNQWPNADVIFYTPWEPDPTFLGTGKPWTRIVEDIFTVADAAGAPVIDIYRRSGGWTTANAAGLMTGTFTPSAAGQKIVDLAAWTAIAAPDNVVGVGSALQVDGVDVVTRAATASVTGSTTAAAVAGREYTYLLDSGADFTLPTAVGNKSCYRVRNRTTGTLQLKTTSAQTIGGNATYYLLPREALTLISDGANWEMF